MVIVITEAFLTLARSLARSRGVPDLPMVVLPHPFETLSEAAIDQFARERFGEILRRLTTSGGASGGTDVTD